MIFLFFLIISSSETLDTAKLWSDLTQEVSHTIKKQLTDQVFMIIVTVVEFQVMMIHPTAGVNGAASFGHLMGGYDCGYYG